METALTFLAVVIDWFRSFTLSDLKFFALLAVALWIPGYFRKLNDRWEKGLAEEFARNATYPPPEADQLKWHVQHIREDISFLCFLISLLIAFQMVLVGIEFMKH